MGMPAGPQGININPITDMLWPTFFATLQTLARDADPFVEGDPAKDCNQALVDNAWDIAQRAVQKAMSTLRPAP
jgi:hypothetical protein